MGAEIEPLWLSSCAQRCLHRGTEVSRSLATICFVAGHRVKLGLVAGLNQLSFLLGTSGLSSHLKVVQTQVIAKQTGSRERRCWKERVH